MIKWFYLALLGSFFCLLIFIDQFEYLIPSSWFEVNKKPLYAFEDITLEQWDGKRKTVDYHAKKAEIYKNKKKIIKLYGRIEENNKVLRLDADEMILNNKLFFVELNTANMTIEGKTDWHLSGHKIKWHILSKKLYAYEEVKIQSSEIEINAKQAVLDIKRKEVKTFNSNMIIQKE